MTDEPEKSSASTPPKEPPVSESIKENATPAASPNQPAIQGMIPPRDHCKGNEPNAGRNEKQLAPWEVFERWVKIVELAAFIAAIITAWFIGVQWREMTKASITADNQLGVMQGQLDEMRQDRMLDERAWVSVTSASIAQPFTAGHVAVNFNLTNTGKTPATIKSVEMNMRITEWKNGLWSTNSATIPTQIIKGTVAPNGLYAMSITEPLNFIAYFNIMKNGQQEHLLDVKIVYEDIFGQVRHTDFGFVVCGDMDNRVVVPDETCRMD